MEAENHYYEPTHTRLLDLGLEPHRLSESLLDSLINIAVEHRERVVIEKIKPRVDWRPPAVSATQAAKA